MDNNTPLTDTTPTPAETPKHVTPLRYRIAAVVSLLAAIAAWLILPVSGKAAIVISAVAVLDACIGLKAKTRLLRNTAITALLASSVLLLVLTAVMAVLYIGINAI